MGRLVLPGGGEGTQSEGSGGQQAKVGESTVVRQRQRAETLLFGKGRKSGDSRLLLARRRRLLLVFLLIL